jgi:hypothetical protein
MTHCRSTRRDRVREVRCVLIFISLCLPYAARAEAEIHKCTDADGGIVYSQLPCIAQTAMKAEKATPDSPDLKAKIAPPVTPKEKTESEANSAPCKKRYRDAIDLIDAEIRREYSPEKNEQYKQRLLQLTRGLRRC